MAQVDLEPLIEQLDDNIDAVEEALAPLLKTALSDTAAKLPLLDRAKLYALSTYAIESLIFSFLRLNGVNAKNHPVFAELNRLKQYFEKIELADAQEQKRTISLNKDAANRFIKHDLAKNDRLDAMVSATTIPVKAGIHTRFPAETDAKAPKSKGATPDPAQEKIEVKDILDILAAEAKLEAEEAIIETPERTRDLKSSSSNAKRPRETDASTNYSDEPKPKKSKSKKHKKKKKKKKRKEGLDVAAEEIAATKLMNNEN